MANYRIPELPLVVSNSGLNTLPTYQNTTDITGRISWDAFSNYVGAYLSGIGVISPAGDPLFASVTTLMHFTGPDASTTFTDVLGGNTWTPSGTPLPEIDISQWAFGGSSALFSGGQALTLPHSAASVFGSGDFNVEVETKPDSLAIYGTILSKSQNVVTGNNAWELYQDATGKPGFRASFDGTAWGVSLLGSSALSLAGFQHVCAERYGNLWTLYVDGQSVASVTVSGTIFASTLALTYGNTAAGGTLTPFSGRLDEGRITKAARYKGNFTPPLAAFPDSAVSTADFYKNGSVQGTGTFSWNLTSDANSQVYNAASPTSARVRFTDFNNIMGYTTNASASLSGMYIASDTSFTVYNKVGLTVFKQLRLTGKDMYVPTANAVAEVRVPRVFVQSGTPTAAYVADGDLWIY